MSEQFDFHDLRDLLAKANEEKSGDQLAGIAARSERERVAAKRKLADLSLAEIVREPLIDPDEDDVSRLLLESFDQERFQRIGSLTVGEFREFLLDDSTTEEHLHQIQWAIIPEIAAAASKIMSNKDLVLAAAKIRNVTRCRNTMGERGVLGIRIQPNHPADDIGGILLAAFEGLLYGCGDAVIGVNPASDSAETTAAILHALARPKTIDQIKKDGTLIFASAAVGQEGGVRPGDRGRPEEDSVRHHRRGRPGLQPQPRRAKFHPKERRTTAMSSPSATRACTWPATPKARRR